MTRSVLLPQGIWFFFSHGRSSIMNTSERTRRKYTGFILLAATLKTFCGYDIPLDTPVFYSGTSAIYAYLFKEMINELQTCRTGYEELLTMYLRQILILVQRIRLERRPSVNTHIQEEMEYARRYFNEHYNEQINIEEYAKYERQLVSTEFQADCELLPHAVSPYHSHEQCCQSSGINGLQHGGDFCYCRLR